MKFIIILYLCSFANTEPVCYSEKMVGLEHSDYHSCILEGYRHSHNVLKKMDKDKINKEKLAIKFSCKEIKTEDI